MKKPTVDELLAWAKERGWPEDYTGFPRAMIEYWIAKAWGGRTIDVDLCARFEAAKEEHRRMVKVRLGMA